MNLDRFAFLIKGLDISLEGVCLTKEDWLGFLRVVALNVSQLSEPQRSIVALHYGLKVARYISYNDVRQERPVPFDCICKQITVPFKTKYQNRSRKWVNDQHQTALKRLGPVIISDIDPFLAKSNGHGINFKAFIESVEAFVPMYVDEAGFTEVAT